VDRTSAQAQYQAEQGDACKGGHRRFLELLVRTVDGQLLQRSGGAGQGLAAADPLASGRLTGPGYARNQLDFREVGQFQLRHHCVGIAQFDGDRQVGDGHTLGRQRRRRAGDSASEDEHAVAWQGLGLDVGGEVHAHFHHGFLGDGATVRFQPLCRAVDPALQGDAGVVFGRQLRQQAAPVIDRLLVALAFKGRDAKQTEAGDFSRVELEGFVGQGLDLGRPLLVVGEVLGLGPLAQQLRLRPARATVRSKTLAASAERSWAM